VKSVDLPCCGRTTRREGASACAAGRRGSVVTRSCEAVQQECRRGRLGCALGAGTARGTTSRRTEGGVVSVAGSNVRIAADEPLSSSLHVAPAQRRSGRSWLPRSMKVRCLSCG
jgi:hypothetical protein